MRSHSFRLAIVFLAVFTAAACAADISGTWKAQFKTNYGNDLEGNPLPRENGETTFTFKQNGEELTGSVTSTAFKQTPIREGKVSGDNISFVLIRSFGKRARRMTYTGTVSGGEIKLQTSIEGFGRGVQMLAKRLP